MHPIMPQIEHIVVLMLENRSFDNLLGWLYSGATKPNHFVPEDGGTSRQQRFNGLYGLNLNKYRNKLVGKPTPFSKERTYMNMTPKRGASHLDVPQWDPQEPYVHVNTQLYGREYGKNKNPPKGRAAAMTGFLQDYASKWRNWSTSRHQRQMTEIMETYTPSQAPIINGLAKSFAVSDEWFSSIPTQTNCNRAMAACGTALGSVDNHWPIKKTGSPQAFNTRTVWNVLAENKKSSWRIFYHKHWLASGFCFTRDLFPQIDERIKNAGQHFQTIEGFYKQAKAGRLPAFSFLEPSWYMLATNGNDYHPPGNLPPGEIFLNKVYEHLRSNKEAWEKTLFVVTFDEHGGTWDHVSPPWGAATPPKSQKGEHGFQFHRYGVRVPTILASPHVAPRTVFRSSTKVPFDHTSLIATILTWFGIPKTVWRLGNRVNNAPTFEAALNATKVRIRAPELRLSPTLKAARPDPDLLLNGLQLDMAPRLVYHLTKDRVSAAKRQEIIEDLQAKVRTQGELNEYLKELTRARPLRRVRTKGKRPRG